MPCRTLPGHLAGPGGRHDVQQFEQRVPAQFVVTYTFDGLVAFRHPAELMPLLEYAQAIRAQRLEIHGHRGAVLLNGGQTLAERPDIGQRRAEQVAKLLRNVGLTAPELAIPPS